MKTRFYVIFGRVTGGCDVAGKQITSLAALKQAQVKVAPGSMQSMESLAGWELTGFST